MRRLSKAADQTGDARRRGDRRGDAGPAEPRPAAAHGRGPASVGARRTARKRPRAAGPAGRVVVSRRRPWIGWFVAGRRSSCTVVGGARRQLAPLGWIVGAVVGLALGARRCWRIFMPRGRRCDARSSTASSSGNSTRPASSNSRRLPTRKARQPAPGARRSSAAATATSRRRTSVRDQKSPKPIALRNAELAPVEPRVRRTHRKRSPPSATAPSPPPSQVSAAAGAERRRAPARRSRERRPLRRPPHRSQQRARRRVATMADAWLAGFRDIADELAAMQERCRAAVPRLVGRRLAHLATPRRTARGDPLRPVPAAAAAGQERRARGQAARPRRAAAGAARGDVARRAAAAGDHRRRRRAPRRGRRAAARRCCGCSPSMPAGKVRFTIIDPAGLGENFAAFMHLADYDEQLVAGRIWTEPKHIDQRLDAHRRAHGEGDPEVPPQRVRHDRRIQPDAPAKWPSRSTCSSPPTFPPTSPRRRPASSSRIAQSGPRCGVYTLLSVDTRAAPAARVQARRAARPTRSTSTGTSERLVWHDPLFEQLPLELDRLPDAERLNDVLRAGRAAVARGAAASRCRSRWSRRRPDKLWTSDSAPRAGRAARPRRRQGAAVAAARQRHVAARAHRRQDRLGQDRRCCTR